MFRVRVFSWQILIEFNISLCKRLGRHIPFFTGTTQSRWGDHGFYQTTTKMTMMAADTDFVRTALQKEDLHWALEISEISKHEKIKKDILIGVDAPWSEIQKQKTIGIHSRNWTWSFKLGPMAPVRKWGKRSFTGYIRVRICCGIWIFSLSFQFLPESFIPSTTLLVFFLFMYN